jgi:hypothetical protein
MGALETRKALQKDVLIPQLIDLVYLKPQELGFKHVQTKLDNLTLVLVFEAVEWLRPPIHVE